MGGFSQSGSKPQSRGVTQEVGITAKVEDKKKAWRTDVSESKRNNAKYRRIRGRKIER